MLLGHGASNSATRVGPRWRTGRSAGTLITVGDVEVTEATASEGRDQESRPSFTFWNESSLSAQVL